jgi:hypothetical protein
MLIKYVQIKETLSIIKKKDLMHFKRKFNLFYVMMNLEQILDFCVERESLFNCSFFRLCGKLKD